MLIFVVVFIEIGKKLLPWESNVVIMQSETTKQTLLSSNVWL